MVQAPCFWVSGVVTRSPWQWLAVAFAAAAAAAWLVRSLITVTQSWGPGFGVADVARQSMVPGLVAYVAVPALGAWLASRRDARGRLGLAVVATWAVVTLPWLVGILLPPSGPFHYTDLGGRVALFGGLVSRSLALPALVVSLVALRSAADPHPLGDAGGARRLAAAAIVVWGLAGTASLLLQSQPLVVEQTAFVLALGR